MNKVYEINNVFDFAKGTKEFYKSIVVTARADAERYVAAIMERYDDMEDVRHLLHSMFETWLKYDSRASFALYRYTAEYNGMLINRMVKVLAEAEDSDYYDTYFAEFLGSIYAEYAEALKDIGLDEEKVKCMVMEAMPDGKYGICGFDIPK